MLAGLTWSVWALFVAAVGLGLAIELRFYLRHRGWRGGDPSSRDRTRPD